MQDLKEDTYLPSVKEQYESLPYPRRNPEDEKQRLLLTYHDFIDIINYYCFEGKRDFNQNFRILVAGGGTGDALIFLAEQLKDTSAELVYVDMSEASMKIAKKRAAIRKLNNITWIQNSLLELPNLDIGKFDYINCVGVLHHLSDPSAGLAALKSVVKEDGAICIMLYGKYGRLAVYPMQELMRLINHRTVGHTMKINNCKKIISHLQNHHIFKVQEFLFREEISSSDNALYDLLLHSQDRPYTVSEVYELVEENKMHIIEFVAERGIAKFMYNPDSYIKDENLLRTIKDLPLKERRIMAELLHGAMTNHSVYMSCQKKQPPQPTDLDMVPFFSTLFYEEGVYHHMYNHIKNSPKETLTIQHPNTRTSILCKKTKYSADFFKFIDGQRTTREIINAMIASYPEGQQPSIETLTAEFVELYNYFNVFDWMILGSKGYSGVKAFGV